MYVANDVSHILFECMFNEKVRDVSWHEVRVDSEFTKSITYRVKKVSSGEDISYLFIM